jgi:hypothetical protein
MLCTANQSVETSVVIYGGALTTPGDVTCAAPVRLKLALNDLHKQTTLKNAWFLKPMMEHTANIVGCLAQRLHTLHGRSKPPSCL